MIPKTLQREEIKFCRIKRGTKKPFEKDWTNKPYSYKEMEHLDKEDYGVLCGYGNLAVIDCDEAALQFNIEELLPKTYQVRTGGGGTHNYFFIPDLKQKIILNAGEVHLGEVQSHGTQVVGPNSTHPSGNKYEELNQEEITTISCEELLSLLKPFMKEIQETEETSNYERKIYSEFDMINVTDVWGLSGLKKQGNEYYGSHPIHGSEGGMNFWINPLKNTWHCFRCNSGGGPLLALAVKEGIIDCSEARKGILRGNKFKEVAEKAREQYNLEPQKTIIEESPETKEIYDDADLINYIPEPQVWLIENQIPKAEVGLLVGKRMERKTFLAIYYVLCLASGEKVFGEDIVPEKKKVLVIDEETGINEIAKRVKLLKKGLGIGGKAFDIKYMSFAGLKLNRRDKKFDKFEKLVDSFKPDLIIVDSLQRCVTFEVDKDNTSISELFTEVVRPIIKKYGCSWLFIHHLRKSPTQNYRIEDPLDEVRGGSELVNYCRFVLMCQSPRGQNETQEGGEYIIFRVLKMSNAPIPEPKVIAFTPNDDGLKVTYEGLPEEVLAGEVQAANGIKEWLFKKQIIDFTTKIILEAEPEIGFKKTLLSSGLKLLLQQRYLEKIKRGQWRVKGGDISQEKL